MMVVDTMKKLSMILALGLFVGLLGACEEQGTAESTGEAVDDAAEAAGEAVDDAAEEAGEAAEDATTN